MVTINAEMTENKINVHHFRAVGTGHQGGQESKDYGSTYILGHIDPDNI